MANQPTTASTESPYLPATQVYGMAAVCLVVGLAIGYVLRGSQSPVSPMHRAANAGAPSAPGGAMGGRQMAGKQAQPPASAGAPSPAPGATGGGRMPSMEEMKQMADEQAAPLREKLKSDPNNSALLMQAGAIYYAAHQFREASTYYGKAVQIDPGNVAFRIKLATSLYSSGNADGAIAQLNQALSYDPKDANALFDLGLIRLRGKQDGKGALAAWQLLLKSNPQLSADRKATVEKLMADVLTTLGDQHGIEGARSNDGYR